MKKNERTCYLTSIYSITTLMLRSKTAIIILLLFSSWLPRALAQSPLDKVCSISLNNEPLKSALDKLSAASGVKFTYNETVAKSTVEITIQAKDQTLRNILNTALAPHPFSYKLLDQEILIRYDLARDKKPRPSPVKSSATKYTVSGTITSQKTGETIIGATIKVAGTTQGTASNAYGFFSITLPAGDNQLAISAMGQKSALITLELTANHILNFAMEDDSYQLKEVSIGAKSRGARDLANPQMGAMQLSIQETKNIPVLLGERDVIKTIQLLPGIKSAGEGSGGFYVRGGAADQNLILLDEAPVYNASHLLGFFSTFNSDAIKNVNVYKGDMPAQYGGRLSSVLDIKMNEGNNQQFGVSGGVGLIAARLNVEGPIQKDKSSFLISARRTYADVFLKLSHDTLVNRSQLYFYDINAKANYILGAHDRLYLSGYFGKDVLSADQVAGINWGNTTGTLRWNHVFNNQLFSNTSLIFSNYDYKINIKQDNNDFTIFSQIRDWNLKEDMQWFPNDKNTVSFGFDEISIP